MTQYLIKKTTHDTGEVFHDVVKARENEVFTLVNAESEDEALEKSKKPNIPTVTIRTKQIRYERYYHTLNSER